MWRSAFIVMSIFERDGITFGIFAVPGAKRCLLCNVITAITDNSYNMVTWKLRNSETFTIKKLRCVFIGL